MHWVEALARRSESRAEPVLARLAGVDVQTMLAVHALLVVAGCWLALSRGRWSSTAAVVAVAGCSLVWFGVNQQWEGRILGSVSATHGLTQADLAVPIVIGAALSVRTLLAAVRRLRAGPAGQVK